MSLFEAISLKGPIVDHIADNYPDDILLFQMHFAIKGRSFRSEPATLREARSVILDTPFVIPADAVAQSTEDPQVLIFITCYSQAQSRQGRNSFGMNVNEQILLAEASLDLATLRLYQGSFLSVDLIPCLHDFINTGGDASAGAIFLRVGEFQPLQSDSEAEALRLLVAQKQSLRAARSRQLFHLVKSFWARVQAEHVHVSNRQLKFIAEDECGRLRFVGSFISAMACQRQIEGPRFAARFVSLIPYRREMTLAGGRVNRWQSAFGTLSSLRGDVEDHCVLLCSLLLGWGFNAYVAQGTIHVDTHSNTNANGGGNSNGRGATGGAGRKNAAQKFFADL